MAHISICCRSSKLRRVKVRSPRPPSSFLSSPSLISTNRKTGSSHNSNYGIYICIYIVIPIAIIERVEVAIRITEGKMRLEGLPFIDES